MKPIIVDMKELSESKEVYNAHPNRFIVYFIYLLISLIVVAFLWAYFFKLDIVVKSNGLFKTDSENIVSSKSSGIVKECNISEGQFVSEGDVLLTLNSVTSDTALENYKALCRDSEERLTALYTYKDYLDGSIKNLDAIKNNKYYSEFTNRVKLYDIMINSTENSTKKEFYQNELYLAENLVTQYEKQLEKWQKVKECVSSRKEYEDHNDTYYALIVSNYISQYNFLFEQYKNSTDTERDKVLKSAELEQMLVVEEQLQNIQIKLNSANSELDNIKYQLELLDLAHKESDIISEKMQILSEISNIEAKLREYKTLINQYEEENSNLTIYASKTGYVYMNRDLTVGNFVSQGEELFKILEQGDTSYARIYVSNSDIARIEEGQKVKISVAAYPASQYGYIEGIVKMVSKDVKADAATGGLYYVVDVLYEDNKNISIKNGMVCEAKIVVDKQSVLRTFLQKIDLID